MLLVSHDRQFVDNTVTECWIFEGNGEIGSFVGGYHDAQQQRAAYKQQKSAQGNKPAAAAKPAAEKADGAKRGGGKLSYNLTRELEQLPQKLETLEARIGELQAKMSHPDFFSQPHDQTQPVLDALAQTEQELETAFARWEELEALKNGA